MLYVLGLSYHIVPMDIRRLDLQDFNMPQYGDATLGPLNTAEFLLPF